MADDTPQYTGGRSTVANKTVYLPPGTGQIRTCRDWNKLRQFSLEHSACYYSPNGLTNLSISIVDKYKHCRDGTKPWLGKKSANAITKEIMF
jgi:hypothetical protein